jgi:glyoxylase-like metal-dependent hydrolase (beta-lactamase superfamily II)
MLSIVPFTLGPVETNAYLVADPQTGQAVVIDPAWDGEVIVAEAERQKWRISSIWLTHAHFDHMAGAGSVADLTHPPPMVALHPEDYPLWRMQGGAPLFGIRIDPGPEPSIDLTHGQQLTLGINLFQVRHAPGHTPGHVIFYCAGEQVVFCGDVIFQSGIGRTDLPGGDYQALMHSIQTQILTLPGKTRLLSGHGPETTVADEMRWNPFLVGEGKP